MIDRDGAARLSTMAGDAFVAALEADGAWSSHGLGELLVLARDFMRDDPGVASRLARLVETTAGGVAPEAVPRAHYLLAQAAAAAGDMAGAIALIDRAAAGFDLLGLQTERLRTNLGRCQALNEMGRHDEALAACRVILDEIDPPPAERLDLVALVAMAHQNSGLCFELTGRFDEALDHYAAATQGYERLDDRRAVAEVTYDSGLALLQLGRHHDALAAFDGAWAMFRDGGYRAAEAQTLASMADVLLLRGEYQRCLDALADAAARLGDIEWPGGQHLRLLAAGRAALALNLLPEALTSLEEAARVLASTDLVIDAANTSWTLAIALARAGRRRDADGEFAAAIDRFEQSGHRSWLAQVLVDRSRLYAEMGRDDDARAAAARAADVALAATPAWALAQLVLLELDESIDAPTLERIVAQIEALALPPLTASALNVLGRARLRRGDAVGAAEPLERSIAIIESLRGDIANEAALSRFLDDKLNPYANLLSALIDSGAPATRCLDIAEQAKSRTLADIVAGLVDRTQSGGDEPHELHAAYAELFAVDPTAQPERLELLRARIRDLEGGHELQRLARADARSPRERPALAAAMPSGAAAVSFSIADGRVHVFAIDGADVEIVGRAELAEISSAVDRLRRQWDRFRLGTAVVERHADQLLTATKTTLHDLYSVLWQGADAWLAARGLVDVVVVPDGVLHDVPFHGLWDGEQWLIERYRMTYAPSMATQRSLPEPRSGRALIAGVADELAPQVENEVAAVAALMTAGLALTGAHAQWATVRERLAGIGHLHIAGHAMFRPDNPMYSAIRLADRWVTAAEVLGLDLNGLSVVLSACETGRTQHRQSAEINGFVRAFLGAGASTVVASLWTADDAATSLLMSSAYRRVGEGVPLHEAVRAAQLETAATMPHPYHWAPWVTMASNAVIAARR